MTDDEKRLVARRAAGEYAVLDACRRIWRKYGRKQRSVYTALLDLIFSGKGDGRASSVPWDEYEAAIRAVLELHPGLRSGPGEGAASPVSLPPLAGQLRRGKILEALRRPWPTRDLGQNE